MIIDKRAMNNAISKKSVIKKNSEKENNEPIAPPFQELKNQNNIEIFHHSNFSLVDMMKMKKKQQI